MKRLLSIVASALTAVGFLTSAHGQIKVAGTLHVNVDATSLPAGVISYITNSGAMGGVFLAVSNASAGAPAQIIAMGGNGTHGFLSDGNNTSLRHYTDITGTTPYVPPAGLTGTNLVFSVEAWVYEATTINEGTVVSWGVRTNGMGLACNYGRSTTYGALSCFGGVWDYSGWTTLPAAATWHHLVWTYDGAAHVTLYRDSVLDRSFTLPVSTNIPNVGPYSIMVGCQHATATTYTSYGANVVGKVRVHSGVLDASQVAANYNYEVASFTNGTPAAMLSGPPLHRYSFNLPATNNAIGITVPDTGSSPAAAAVVRGSNIVGAIPFLDGDQLTFPSFGGNSLYTNGYVDLPNGILSSLSANNGGPGQVSFELWVQLNATATWCELLYMGSSTIGEIIGVGKVTSTNANSANYNGANGIVIPGLVNTSAEQSGWRGVTGDRTIGARIMDARRHIVVTWDEAANVVKIYHQGTQVGQFIAAAKINAVVDVNNWLGRSGWMDANTPSSYREFRMYGRVLTPAEIRRDYIFGPYNAQDSSTLSWNGNVDGNWDTSTLNWLGGGASTNYSDGSSVNFDDTATGTTSVTLSGTVLPKTPVTLANSTKSYTFSGAGKISGPIGVVKSGTGTATVNLANDYTGSTVIQSGTLSVSSLANGGLPSPIGAASASALNLLLAGGTLNYTGPATKVDRGYYLTGFGSTLDLQSDLNFAGQVTANNMSGLVKTGNGTLTYSTIGSNLISAGGFPGLSIAMGTVVFDGTAGTQTSRNMSELWVGSSTANGANLVVSNATLYLDSWLAVARGNGGVGNLSTLTLANGIVTTAANGISMGYSPLTGNLARQITTLNGASSIYCAGNANLGESTGSFGTMFVNGTSWFRTVTPRLGISAGATGAVYVADSGRYTNTAYMSIGTGSGAAGVGSGGVGLFVAKDNAIISSTGDFNLTDLANSVGRLDISNNATLYVNGNTYIGKADGTLATVNQSGGSFLKIGGGDFVMAGFNTASPTSVGTWNISGGSIYINGNFQVGAYGQGTFNQTGGAVSIGGWPSIGRYYGGTGIYNISGGTLTDTNLSTDIIVGEGGTGILNISGTGLVTAMNTVRIGNLSGGMGTVNLNGGTLTAKHFWMPNSGAFSTFNFNGGTLLASPGSLNDFMSGLSSVNILAGGAVVDSGTNDIAIAQDFYTDNTGGGLTKLGTGSLYLPNYLYFSGPTVVNRGLLTITTRAAGGGTYSITDGATLALQVVDFQGASIPAASLTIGTTTGAALTFNLGSFGNPPTAPMNVSAGAVTINGTGTINIDPSSSLSVGSFPLIQYGSIAGVGSLVLGTLPPGVFANLVTNVPNSTIDLEVTAVFQPRWEGLAGGFWDIQVTTNWVDMNMLTPQFFYQGTRAVFNDEALGTNYVNLVTTVSPGGVLSSNSAINYTIGGTGRITGGGGLVKVGVGSLTISTTNNTYTGATVIDEGGTLATTVPNNIGTNSPLFIGSGTLSLGANSQKFGQIYVTNGIVDATTATITSPSYMLDNGVINAPLAGGTLSTFGAATDVITVVGGNTYTGRTYLAGSTLAVTNLANGGLASGLGASSASPTNLVFAGGGLSYSGPKATTDRGYYVLSGGRLDAAGNVTFGGPITASAGNFAKTGAGAVTYSALGSNVFSRGGGANAFAIGAGSVVMNGGASTPTNYLQTNYVAGEIWVGHDQVNAGALTLTNSSLGASSWLAIDRGNGTLGLESVVNLYDSYVGVPNCSMGYDNGIVGNYSRPALNLYGKSQLVDPGAWYVGESAGSDARVSINGTSVVTIGAAALLGRNTATSTGAVTIANSGTLTVNGGAGYLSVGGSGVGTLSMRDNAVVNNARDENIGDVTGSQGVLNMSGNATNLTANLYVGKSGTSTGVINMSGGYLGRWLSGLVTYVEWRVGGGASTNDAAAVGTVNFSGGVIDTGGQNFQVGAYGVGYYNQSGGTFTCSVWPSMGRFPGSVGTLTISGGVFNQTGTGNRLIIGEQGTASLTLSGTGYINCLGGLTLGHQATGSGLVNLDGGRIATPLVGQPGGATAFGTFNFNGGVLQANANNGTFMTGLTAANVLAGGAIIDSDTNSITIAQPLLDGGTGGGLTKLGTGSLVLSGANTYVGSTLVSSGTLRVNGSIASANVDVKPGATLGGTGTIGGNVSLEATSILSPGASVGTLTVNGNLAIAGNMFIEVDKALTPNSDQTVVSGSLINTGAGQITVTNIGTTPFAAGDTFRLFSQPVANGAAFTISPSLGPTLVWTNRLAIDGTIAILSGVAQNPTNITYVVNGGTITLSWPADHLGWILQVQTNSIMVGISNNWHDVIGSGSSTQAAFNINPEDPTVFFRIRSP